jgi:tRNA (cmo5U34)-methyltransferase
MGTFDAVVSSFAIHHTTDERKRSLYAEIFDMVRPGGVFANLEHVSSPTPELHEDFRRALGTHTTPDDTSNKLAPVTDQLAWMTDAGFMQVDCLWKWRELALMVGVRPFEP